MVEDPNDEEAERLRRYFDRGGFLWADDKDGMDASFRVEIAKVLPEDPLVELPFDHGIYHSFYDFPTGLRKVLSPGVPSPPEKSTTSLCTTRVGANEVGTKLRSIRSGCHCSWPLRLDPVKCSFGK